MRTLDFSDRPISFLIKAAIGQPVTGINRKGKIRRNRRAFRPVLGDGDDRRAVCDSPVDVRFQEGGVEPKIGSALLDLGCERKASPLVGLLAEPACLALGEAARAHGTDQPVHGARGDPVEVGLLVGRREGSLRNTKRFKESKIQCSTRSFGKFRRIVPARVSQSRQR